MGRIITIMVELLLLFIILFILFIVLLLLILKLVNREAEPKTTFLFFCFLIFSIKYSSSLSLINLSHFFAEALLL